MADWLHFIGRAYYPTPEIFAAETEQHPVTRRIAATVLRNVSYGDTVHCAMLDEKGKTVVFGVFNVECVSGLSRAAMLTLITEQPDQVRLPEASAPDPEHVILRAGDYLAAPPVTVDMSPRELLDAIAGVEDVGKLMVGGPFRMHKNLGTLKDVKQRQGFRLFDYKAFSFARDRLIENGLTPDLSGMFYARQPEIGPGPGEVQSVSKFRRQEQQPWKLKN